MKHNISICNIDNQCKPDGIRQDSKLRDSGITLEVEQEGVAGSGWAKVQAYPQNEPYPCVAKTITLLKIITLQLNK